MIPFEPMWAAFRRIIKPRGAIVLTASQPFTSALVMSWPQGFRYEWIWDKKTATGGQNAEFMPMKAHESILVFALKTPKYIPQLGRRTKEEKRRDSKGVYTRKQSALYGGREMIGPSRSNPDVRYPASVIRITGLGAVDGERLGHPTQKPVALFEYLIRTYTQPGELVFDPTAGSGTTAVAARQTGRHYIVGDSSAEYVAIMRERLAKPYTLPMLELEAQDAPEGGL